MAWNKETALEANQKAMKARQGLGEKVSKDELIHLISTRLRDSTLEHRYFVALTNTWMMLTGRKAKPLPATTEQSDGDDVDALVKKLERERR
jgi:hypothetical protein